MKLVTHGLRYLRTIIADAAQREYSREEQECEEGHPSHWL